MSRGRNGSNDPAIMEAAIAARDRVMSEGGIHHVMWFSLKIVKVKIQLRRAVFSLVFTVFILYSLHASARKGSADEGHVVAVKHSKF